MKYITMQHLPRKIVYMKIFNWSFCLYTMKNDNKTLSYLILANNALSNLKYKSISLGEKVEK